MTWKPGSQRLNHAQWAKINVDSNENVMDRWIEHGEQTPRWQRAKMALLLRKPVHPDDFKAFLKEAHDWNKATKAAQKAG